VNEIVLLRVSLIFSLIGILILFMLTYELKVKLYEINSLSKDNIDDVVRVKGVIESFAETPGLYLITLSDNTGKMTVVIFKDEKIPLQKNLEIEIIGSVVEYKDKIEIIAKQIVI